MGPPRGDRGPQGRIGLCPTNGGVPYQGGGAGRSRGADPTIAFLVFAGNLGLEWEYPLTWPYWEIFFGHIEPVSNALNQVDPEAYTEGGFFPSEWANLGKTFDGGGTTPFLLRYPPHYPRHRGLKVAGAPGLAPQGDHGVVCVLKTNTGGEQISTNHRRTRGRASISPL